MSYKQAKDYVYEFLVVSEESVTKAVSFMAKEEKFIVAAGSCSDGTLGAHWRQ